jgi:hypothetical protein
MSDLATVEIIIERFNHAFVAHDPVGFADLISDGCVMEAIEPAPDGARLVVVTREVVDGVAG